MTHFTYKNNELHCEGVALKDIAKDVGTPFYVYSYNHLREQFTRFTKAFSDVNHLICYSMKANSNAAILKTFLKEGSGIDVVTEGELYRALKAGCDPKKIVFAGVGKQAPEIWRALDAGILQFNVESEAELDLIQEVASSKNKKAPIAFRVNPDVDPKTHAYISTGMKKSKFGVNHEDAIALYKKASQLSHIEVVGIDCHIGSQLTTLSPIVDAIRKVKGWILELKELGINLKNLDIGGGLGIVYKDETPPSPEEYAAAVKKEVDGLGLRLIFEPGRYMVGNAGHLVTRVVYNKQRDIKHFVIVDAASNDLMRPMMYQAYHGIVPVDQIADRKTIKTDVVGPICETGDFFAQDRDLPEVESGELLALQSAGAYGFAMASTYNSRPLCTEVMVNGGSFEIIRKRGDFEELTRGERVPSFL